MFWKAPVLGIQLCCQWCFLLWDYCICVEISADCRWTEEWLLQWCMRPSCLACRASFIWSILQKWYVCSSVCAADHKTVEFSIVMFGQSYLKGISQHSVSARAIVQFQLANITITYGTKLCSGNLEFFFQVKWDTTLWSGPSACFCSTGLRARQRWLK